MRNIPKNYKNNLDVYSYNNLEGDARRQQLLDRITFKDGWLPKGIHLEDLDSHFMEAVDKDMAVTVEGKRTPSFLFTIQRWSEFTKTWTNLDKNKNIELPFISIIRKPEIEQGTNQGGYFNIPGERNYHMIRVPRVEYGKTFYDIYKIPQPTSVDLTYEIKFFSFRMRDVNQMEERMVELFKSMQYYISVNGHYMPVKMEGITNESNINEFENRRFYTITFTMKLMGYLMDEKDFTMTPSINNLYLSTDIVESKEASSARYVIEYDEETNGVMLIINFTKTNFNNVKVTFDRPVNLNNLQADNVMRVTYNIDNRLSTLPLLVSNQNDSFLNVSIEREDINKVSTITLTGTFLNE